MDENQKWLHGQLRSRGLYTKGYDDFVSDYSSQKAQEWLHGQLKEKKLFTNEFSDFKSTYFSATVEKKNPVGNASPTGSLAQPTAPVAVQKSSDDSFDPASLLSPQKQEIPQYVAAPKQSAWGAPTPGIKQPSSTSSLGIETSPSDGVVDPKFIKRNDQRIALSNIRDSRKGDYQSDAIERMERSLSEKEKVELARTSLIEGDNMGVTNAQYQAQLNAIKKDQTDLSNGLDGIDQEISESLGENAFDQYEQNISKYAELKGKYDAAAKSKDHTAANRYVDELNDLQSEIEKFQQHPLVQERTQMVKAMQKNLDRFKSMETDERYKTVKSLEADRRSIQGQVDEQDWMSDFSGMVVRGVGNMAAGVGRMAKNVNEIAWGEDAEPTPISNFLIDLGEGANFYFPSPSQYSRGLVTDTAKWGDYEVDFKGDEVQAVRKDGKSVQMQLTDEQISEIKGLEKSKQVNWSVAPYQAANVIVDMGIMLAGADKITKGLTAFKVGERAAAKTGVALSTAGQMANGMYEQGLELFDGDKKKAAEFSFFGLLAVGAVQNVFGMEQRLLTGRVLDTKSISAAVGKMTPKQMGLEFGKMYAKEVAGEGFEEGLIEPLVTAAASYTIGGKADIDPTEMVSNGAMGLMVGTLFAGGNLNLNELQKSSLYNVSKDPVAFEKALRAAVEKGEIAGDEEFISQQVSRMNRIGGELSRLAPDLKQEELLDATAIIDEKIQAEARLKNAKGNEELEKRYQAEVDVLNGHLNGMMKPPTKEVAQKISENKAEEEGVSAQKTQPAKSEAINPAPPPQEPVSTGEAVKEGEAIPAHEMNRRIDSFNNENEYFRVIVGDEAFNDIVESGVVRTNASSKERASSGIDLANRPTAFPSFSKGKVSIEYAKANENNYIIVTNDQSIQASKSGRHGKGTTFFPTDQNGNHQKELSGNNISVYKHIGNGEYQLVYKNGKKIEQAVTETTANAPVEPSVPQEPIQAGSGTPPMPPIATTGGTTEAGQEGMVDKKIVNERAYKGDVRPEIKKYLEKKGLKRDVEDRDEAIAAAADMVEELGVDTSMEAVRSGEVEGGLASATIFKSLESLDAQIAASTDPKEIGYLAQKYADITAYLDEEGVKGGRFIGMLGRMYMDSDLGWNANIKKSEYVKRFGSITPEVEAKFEELEAQLKDVSKRLAEAEKRAADAAEKATIETIKAEAEKKKPTKASISVAGKELAKKIRKGKLSRPGTFSAASPASLVWDAAIEIAATSIEAGSSIAEAIQKGLSRIKQSDWYKGLSSDKKRDAEQEYSDFLNDYVDSVGKLKVPKSLIRDLVAGGIDNVPDLVDAVRNEMGLEEESDREIRDAITEYEKVINMTKDDISREVSRLKTLGKLMSKIEDAVAGIRPKRTGLQRPQYTKEQKAEIRAKERELREAMKNLPTDTETAAGELLSRLDAKKSRIKNRIEDIKKAIRDGKVIERNDKPLLTDQETADLEAELREQEEAYETAFADILAEAEEKRRLENNKKSTRRSIEELERRIRERDFAKKERKPLIEDSELTELRAEKLKVKEEYDKAFYSEETRRMSRRDKAIKGLWEVWGVTRVLTASLDASFMFVQGGIMTISNPSHAIQAIKEAMKVLGSEKKSEEFSNKIKSQDWYPIAKQSKLALTEAHTGIKTAEELFFSGWSDFIWNGIVSPARIFGQQAYEKAQAANPFRATERAAVAYLDTLRILKFQEMLDGPLNGKNFSEHKQEFRDVADAINTLTGRASLGRLEAISQPLTKIIFSPRNWASQVKMFSPYALKYFGNLTPSARKMALLSMGKFIAFNTGMMMMLAAAFNNDDDEETGVEFDPRSSDFMKLKLGDTRIDPWGGKIQQVTFAVRMFMDMMFDVGIGSGAFKNRAGEILPLGVRDKTSDRKDIALQQFFNKLSPSARIVYNNWNAQRGNGHWKEDDYGNEYSLADDIKESLYPMYIQTVLDLKKDGFDVTDSVLTFLAFMGYGVNKYESKQEAKQRKKEEAKRERQQSK